MAQLATGSRSYRGSPLLWVSLAILLMVVFILTGPALLRIFESERERQVRSAIEAASNICLLDQSRKSSDNFLSSVITSIRKLDAQGKLERETATRSVDLAIDKESLLYERERVRACMKEQVPIYLAQGGLLALDQASKNAPKQDRDTTPEQAEETISKPDAIAWQTVEPGTSVPAQIQCPCLNRSLLPPPYPTPFPKGAIAQILNQCTVEVKFIFFKHVPRPSATTIVDVLQAKTVLQPRETRTFDVSGAVTFGHFVETCAAQP